LCATQPNIRIFLFTHPDDAWLTLTSEEVDALLAQASGASTDIRTTTDLNQVYFV